MNSPRSGFRRVAVASWALAGLGAAGVAGASALAYGDTVKPMPVEDAASVEQPAAPAAPITVELPALPPVAPQPTFEQAYTPTYTSPAQQRYTQAQTTAPPPAPASSGPIGGSSSSSSSSTKSPSASSSSSSSSTTKHIPMGTSGGPNKAVPHTIARGS